MNKRLLDIPIVCPVTKVPLQLLDSERLTILNAAIRAGQLQNRAAQFLSEPLSEALVTRNGRSVYPVRDGKPVLLEEESIDWHQLGQ